MKNILARGGIEFLAVLLGITGSLWVDESRVASNADKAFQNDLVAIHNELVGDLDVIDEMIAYNNDMTEKISHLLMVMEASKIDVNALDTIPIMNESMGNRSFFGKKGAYQSSKSAGHLNRNSHSLLIQEMTRLYDQTYVRMEYNNNLIDDLLFRDDKSIVYLSHHLRGFVYNENDFYQMVNNTEFYNWAVRSINLIRYLNSVMKITRDHMVKVEAMLREELERS